MTLAITIPLATTTYIATCLLIARALRGHIK